MLIAASAACSRESGLPVHAGGPTIIVTIILVLVTRKP